MPSCSYHLKFELYPAPDPIAPFAPSETLSNVWHPTSRSTIFDKLPEHPRRNYTPPKSSADERRKQKSPDTSFSGTQHSRPNIIDCGARPARPNSSHADDDGRNIVRINERQWQERADSFLSSSHKKGLGPEKAVKDWRFGPLSIESLDLDEQNTKTRMASEERADYTSPEPAPPLGPVLAGLGSLTRAKYVKLETKNTEIGWGIVHLYREGDGNWAFDKTETQDGAPGGSGAAGGTEDNADEDGGTVLCITSVPVYMSPSDFLVFIGEKWREDISHYRMIMTSRMNRYMVLMKFRDKKRAEQWRKEVDGTVFNRMEPEICHVTYIKSITIETPSLAKENESLPGVAVSNTLRPFPPPTPDLTELPTCAVCLERMDNTAGLMTTLCQHVFHCTCLQTWKGQGCPICRATNPNIPSSSAPTNALDPSNPYSQPFGNGVSNLCSVCDCAQDLWICLICGYLGCGRYKGGHAKDHWKETAHCFSLELETQHVWDYAGDAWVHRLIRDKGDGKVVELPPGSRTDAPGPGTAAEGADVVPRTKLDDIGVEYTHLLTSQLESQRLYFEEMVNKAADKASAASAQAEAAMAQSKAAMAETAKLRSAHGKLAIEVVPALEKDLERERRRADKATELSKKITKSLQEEKKVSEGLMERVKHLQVELETTKARTTEVEAECAELKEMNRDLTMFISGQEKLKELEAEGKVDAGEIAGGSVGVEKKNKGRVKR